MTDRRYTRGLSFLGHLQRYTSSGRPLAEAKQRLLRRINAGEFVVDKPLTLTPPVLHLELAARDRLFFVTAMERVDVSDVFTLEPVQEEPLFSPPTPMSDAVFERFKAKLRQPGLTYVVSSRGVETPADVLDRLDRPEPAPVADHKPSTIRQRRKDEAAARRAKKDALRTKQAEDESKMTQFLVDNPKWMQRGMRARCAAMCATESKAFRRVYSAAKARLEQLANTPTGGR